MGRLLRDIGAAALAVGVAILAVLLVAGCKKVGDTPAASKASPAVIQPESAQPVKPAPAPAATVRGIPQNALRLRAELTRNARAIWGLSAPVATFAAQVQQESGWRAEVKSPVGAQGMAQFMPATADWISRLFPELAANEPFNPSWALRALVTYDRYLWERLAAATDCDRMAMALSAYNGGLGWVRRDAALAATQGLEPEAWWDHVETVNAGRTAANWRENRGYPRRILRTLSPLYASAGFGGAICHD